MKLLTRMKVAAMAVVCALVANVASAATATVNGVTYEYQVVGNSVAIGNDDWEPAISTSTSGALTIPSKINGLPVTWIKDGAFKGCANLTSVTIPDGVTTLGLSAFMGCTSLRSVSMPDSVNNISYYTFSGCSSLTSVKMPKNLVYLGHRAFENCSSLRTVSIPANVVKVGDCVFEGTQFLADKADGLVVLDGWLVDIKGEWPTSVNVPNGVKGIAEFYVVDKKLTSLSVPSSVVYNWIDGLSYTEWHKNKMANAGNGVVFSDGWVVGVKGTCPSSVVLPKGTKGILARAFSGCTSLKSITIPEGVSSVGFEAFLGCENLKSISLPSTVKALDSMSGVASVSELTIPASVVYVGWGALMSDALRTLNFSGKPCAVDQSEGPYVVYDSSSTVGYYTSTYAKEWKAVLDAEDKWYGLTMKQKSGSDYQPKPSSGIFDSAQTFNGWLTGDGFAGTIQVKTTKATANRKTGVVTSKATATVSVVGGKKQTFSGNLEIDEDGTYGYLEVEKNGRYLYVEMSSDGLYGEYSDDEYGYEIQGVRDLFASTDADDKAYVSEVLANWKKTVRCAWQSETDYESSFDGYNTMTFTVGAKGKTKVAGTLVDGTKFSVASQMIIGGDGSCYVPVIVSKKGVSLSFNLILSEDGFSNCRGEGIEADGLDAEYIRFGTSTEIVDDTLTVEVDTGAYLWDLLGGEEGYVYSDLLPDGLEISVKNSKLTLPKAGKVVMDRYGEIDYDKAGDNPSGLKLSYKAKDGTFTGSFKAYVDNNGRLKTVTVSVSGLIIDGIGYGTATVKKVGSVPFRLLGLTYAEWCTIAVATDGIGVNSSGL